MKLTTNWMILAIVLGAVTITSATAVITDTDDTTLNDLTSNDGTTFTLRTDASTGSAESVFLFSHNGKTPAEAWKFRLAETADGFSIIQVGVGERMRFLTDGNVGIGTFPQEKLDVGGNIRLTGNIVSPGDICIGTCP